MLRLEPHDVHVWTAEADRVHDAAILRELTGSLSTEEVERLRRFHFEADRHLYAVAHGLVRRVLSLYATRAPHAWRFVTNEHGRPELAPGSCELPLRFNLSHTRGYVAFAVALDREVGVDVEHTRPRAFSLDVADRFFAPAEVRALMTLPESQRRDRFFDLWTLKESYIKARGMGLALPLDRFAFEFAPGDIRLEVEESIQDGLGRFFRLESPSPDHRLALCVECGTDESLAVQVSGFEAW